MISVFLAVFLLFTLVSCKKEEEHVHEYVMTEHEADCENDGYKEYICACGDSYTEKTDDKTGHLYFWTLSSYDGETVFETGKCVRCEKTIDKQSVKNEYDYLTADTDYLTYTISRLPEYADEYCEGDAVAEYTGLLVDAERKVGSLMNYEYSALAETLKAAAEKLEYKKGNVTRIYISSSDGITDAGYVSCKIAVVPSSKNETGFFYDGSSKIKVRGNSTALADKKGYNFKLSEKQDFFGFGKAKKWALLANAYDKTLIRNKIALDLEREMGIEYASQSAVAEVWINGRFLGSFQLCESVEVGKDRVDIDVSKGDALLEVESQRTESGVKYITAAESGIRFAVNDPEDISDDGKILLNAKLNAADSAILSGDINEIKKVIDVDSFAKFYVFSEFVKQVDFSYSSTRFYFKDGILYAGPGWDFDLSSGNVGDGYAEYSEYNNGGSGSSGLWIAKFPWYEKLLECKEFRNLVKDVYKKFRPTLENVYKNNEKGQSRINFLLSEYKSSYLRNYSSTDWSLNTDTSYGKILDTDYDGYVSYLKNWFSERLEFLDGIYGK